MAKGQAVGIEKGHIVTKRTLAKRPGARKGVRRRLRSAVARDLHAYVARIVQGIDGLCFGGVNISRFSVDEIEP